MNALNLNLLVLQARLALVRLGWTNSVACIIGCAGIAAWLWGLPYLRAETAIQQQTLEQAQLALQSASHAPVPAPRPLAEEHLANFYDNLGDQRYAEQQVRTLFAIAGKMQLVLNQAEYKSAFDKNGRYHTYQISLPVRGSYDAIRQFCEQSLLAIPFAALDEINFKREAISSRVLEAKLRFTLYLGAGAPTLSRRVAATAAGGES